MMQDLNNPELTPFVPPTITAAPRSRAVSTVNTPQQQQDPPMSPQEPTIPLGVFSEVASAKPQPVSQVGSIGNAESAAALAALVTARPPPPLKSRAPAAWQSPPPTTTSDNGTTRAGYINPYFAMQQNAAQTYPSTPSASRFTNLIPNDVVLILIIFDG